MKTNFNFVTGPGESASDRAATLDQLQPGERGVVAGVDEAGPIGRRLLDLGFLPGTPVCVLRRAPLGDPAVFELRGYQLCLRATESARIRIDRA